MPIFVESHNIISSLGLTSSENFNQVVNGISGIKLTNDNTFSTIPTQLSLIKNDKIEECFSEISNNNKFTKFEKICILSIKNALLHSNVSFKSKKTLLILSTTKGNIELIGRSHTFDNNRVHLWKTAKVIGDFFHYKENPLVISNACISGLSAIIFAKRLLENDAYDNAVIIGADVISQFIVSGFHSFNSLSSEPCKPFDISRNGLNIGEAAATIILTKTQPQNNSIEIVNGSISNDANHISGPSRTGDGLYNAIINTIKTETNIGFISAHGTATPYNDNMEAVAITRAKINHVPVSGLKGYFGHTLGAAGVLESIISIESMKNNIIPKTIGFSNLGVTEEITVTNQNILQNYNSFLKLTSGFGGCNAAALYKKY